MKDTTLLRIWAAIVLGCASLSIAISAICLALIATPARGQTLGFECAPKEFGGSGTYYTVTDTADGRSRFWVCGRNADGSPKLQHLTRLADWSPSSACSGAVAAADAAPDLVAAANAALAACRAEPAASTTAGQRYGALKAAGKAAVMAKWNADNPPAGGAVYRTPSGGSAIYPVVNGKPGLALPGRRAAGNALCNCAVTKVTSGSYTYCALDGGPPTEVAVCLKVSP